MPSLLNWDEITRVRLRGARDRPKTRRVSCSRSTSVRGSSATRRPSVSSARPLGVGALITAMASVLRSTLVEFSTTEADAAATAGGEIALLARLKQRVRRHRRGASRRSRRATPRRRDRRESGDDPSRRRWCDAGVLVGRGGIAPSHPHVRDVGNAEAAADHPSANLPKATSNPGSGATVPGGLRAAAVPRDLRLRPVLDACPSRRTSTYKDLTTLAYFSVDANPDGTLDQSGAGWNGYESQDLVDLVNRVARRRRPGGAHRHRLQPELARRDHLGPERAGPAVVGADLGASRPRISTASTSTSRGRERRPAAA